MIKTTLSDRQAKILEFLGHFIREHGFPPSVRDIQEGLQPRVSSTSVVDYNLKALEDRGLIRRSRGISRAIELVDHGNSHHGDGHTAFRIPVAPTPIAAGQPIPVLDDVRASSDADTMDLTEALLGRHIAHPEQLYALRVKGTSMIDDFINDGDVVIVLLQETAEIGQTVVAWLRAEQEATLKKYYPEGNRVRLQPANEAMSPIYTAADNLDIRGRVVGVIRTVA